MNKTCGRKNHGFTLAELLVVVAIIAVLVAVSVPIFTSQLDKAKVATNQANIRSAKSAAAADYLSTGCSTAAVYAYDINSGELINFEQYSKDLTTRVKVNTANSYQLLITVSQTDNNVKGAIEYLDSYINGELYSWNNPVSGIYQFTIVYITPDGTQTCPHYDSSTDTIVDSLG